MTKDDDIERQLWTAAWLAVAASSNCRNLHTPATWADRLLADYKERFSNAPVKS